MKRKLIISVIALFTLCSTAYAAVAINGLYKGRPIVSTLVNGQKVVSEVPGQIIDNSTMLPLRAIAESLGADVKWDQSKYQASVTLPQQPVQPVQQGLSLEQLNKIGESVGEVHAYSGDTYEGQGSGFIVNGNVFVTNHHVIENTTQLVIQFSNKSVTVQVNDALFDDKDADLAAFTVEGYPSLELNIETLQNKEKVYALGYPHNKFTITDGFYIALFQGRGLQATAKTDHGSSGGILIDEYGKVIGITSSGVDGQDDWNFAIPAQTLQDELNKL